MSCFSSSLSRILRPWSQSSHCGLETSPHYLATLSLCQQSSILSFLPHCSMPSPTSTAAGQLVYSTRPHYDLHEVVLNGEVFTSMR